MTILRGVVLFQQVALVGLSAMLERLSPDGGVAHISAEDAKHHMRDAEVEIEVEGGPSLTVVEVEEAQQEVQAQTAQW